MNPSRRSFVGVVLAGSMALSGCLSSGSGPEDIELDNRTGESLELRIEIELQNGESEVVTESTTVIADEDWDWNEAGDRGISRVRIETDDGQVEEEVWEEPIYGYGISISVSDTAIEIVLQSA